MTLMKTSTAQAFIPTGTVYGTLLNFKAELAALQPQMNQPPYKVPPQAPVLYIKPANTWSADSANIAVPARVPVVEIGATIGMVVSGFMTLHEGDVLMLGCDCLPTGKRPVAKVGDVITISSPSHPALGTLSNTFVAEAV